jgi:hypothetical protein
LTSPRQPSPARREKRRRKLARPGVTPASLNALTNALVERYKVFDPAQRLPLAIGIHSAILADLGCAPWP